MKLLKKLVQSKAGFSNLALRIPVGIIFMLHGEPKLFGLFGGHGLEETAKFMTKIGLEPGMLMAILSGGAEFFGGVLIIIGFLIRPAAILTTITMVVAIVYAHVIHLNQGFFPLDQGFFKWDRNLILIAVSIFLLFSGAGRFSVDRFLWKRLK